MLSFDNLTAPTFGLIEQIHVNVSDRYLSYLPVSHGMERWVGECVPFVTGSEFICNSVIIVIFVICK